MTENSSEGNIKKNHQILYVDDERQNLVSFKATFRKHYTIFAAQSGEDAIEILRNHKIDLIISDQRMPEMTGVQLFEKILYEFPDAIRMVLTGYSDVQSIIDAINKGQVYYYITKPWKHDELKLVMDKALEAYELRLQNKALSLEKEELQLEAERQAKENLFSQYQTLKSQVNPHFLFNSLNALYALVDREPKTAKQFIVKLSKVYRYALEYTDEITIRLEDELRFIRDYIFLQKIRFNENLVFKNGISGDMKNTFIPPATLQLLVENAIKHNIVSQESPLIIELYIEDTYLVVKNNFQIRKDTVVSTGIGQKNLTSRYSYITERKPIFGQKGAWYYAKVPLINEE
ncbi:MAG: histidine kinase [Chitinophagales bacterium]